MLSRATCRLASPDEHIAAQHAVIARFEAALWADGGVNASLLPSYQSAWRRLKTLIAARGDDCRHLSSSSSWLPTALRRAAEDALSGSCRGSG
jgi:hypothetical protein